MIKVFIINGQGGAGKNTFVDFIYDFEEYVYEMSSIDPIKEIAKKFCWNQAKTEKDRKFLSDLKNLSIEYNNFPFTYCLNKIYKIQNNLKYIEISSNLLLYRFRVGVNRGEIKSFNLIVEDVDGQIYEDVCEDGKLNGKAFNSKILCVFDNYLDVLIGLY